MDYSRRMVLKAGFALGASVLASPRDILAQAQPLIQKKIPSTGESIPIIGLGTARRYEEIKTDAEKVPLRETIRQFQARGGTVIDSSPSYGTAEAVVGELVEGLKIRDSLFLATKVSLRKGGREEGIAQIEASFKKYRTNKIGAWSYAGLGMFGLGMNGIAIVAVPISLFWLLNGLWLGRRQDALASAQNGPSRSAASAAQ